MRFSRFLLLISIAAGCLSAVHAQDGRLEINQACAAGDGCFGGDDPGFPVQLVQPGSYVLTGQLTPPDDTTALLVSASAEGSTIDLNGFEIRGPEACSGTPVTSCSGTASADGISGSSTASVTVKNGRISGMARVGILLGRDATIEQVEVEACGSAGISLGDASTVVGARAERNLFQGINLGRDARVRSVHVAGNGSQGVIAGDGAVVSTTTSHQNGMSGIYLESGSLMKDATVSESGSYGVNLEGDAAVIDSVVRNNSGVGIRCQAAAAVQGNTLAGNGAGPLTSACVEVASNYCGADLNC